MAELWPMVLHRLAVHGARSRRPDTGLGWPTGTIDAAARSLLRIAGSIDTAKAGPLAGLLVVTPTGYAHTRPDGVTVAPLTTLAS